MCGKRSPIGWIPLQYVQNRVRMVSLWALLVLLKKQSGLGRKVCWYFRGILQRFGGIGRWFSVHGVGILYIASEKKGSERDETV